METNNHASPAGNAPPWAHIAKMTTKGGDCETIYADLNGHRHGDNKDGAVCNWQKTGRQSEHTARGSMFMKHRSGGKACGQWGSYDIDDAPCVCMNTKRVTNPKKQRSRKKMPHDLKTKDITRILSQHRQSGTVPSTGEMVKASAASTSKRHSRTKRKTDTEKEQISECLELINLTYLAGVTADDKDTDEAKAKVEEIKKKPICAMAVNGVRKSVSCPACGA